MFESLKNRDFRLLWLNQISATLAMNMDQTARSWLIYSLTHSAMHLGMISAVRGIPLLLFGLISGTIADRVNRKTLLFCCPDNKCVFKLYTGNAHFYRANPDLAYLCDRILRRFGYGFTATIAAGHVK